MNATRTFEIKVSERFHASNWWNNKYPREPYWEVMQNHAERVMRKYHKGVLRDIRQMLQNRVGKAIITELRLVADTTYSVTVMGEQDEIDQISSGIEFQVIKG